jgi:hypothetical protein
MERIYSVPQSETQDNAQAGARTVELTLDELAWVGGGSGEENPKEWAR